MMPEMDGFETFVRLRPCQEELRMEDSGCISYCGRWRRKAENRSYAMGIADYIRKPFDPDDLINRIDKIIEKQRKNITVQGEVLIDPLTGLLSRSAIMDKLGVICRMRQAAS